jgi:hypothetical protein
MNAIVPVPVELTAFTAITQNNKVALQWKTATEVNNYGFEVERRSTFSVSFPYQGGDHGSDWQKIGFVNGNGTSNIEHSYSYTDNSVSSGTYAYRIKQVDNDGTYKYSHEAEVTIEAPRVFALNQNYPNPFNPTTTISFTLAQDGKTTLKIYDMLGREVAMLVNEELKAGVYHQVLFNASRLASGIYFSCLETRGQKQIKKIMLIK